MASAIAELVIRCTDVGANQAFFCEQAGFRVLAILPADGPTMALLAGHGIRVRLEAARVDDTPVLRIPAAAPGTIDGGATLVAPGGATIQWAPPGDPIELPPLRASFVHVRGDADGWVLGRAGMRYRDLLPDRQGGRFVASQIRIVDGGPVADWVHHHAIVFQLIYCLRGWIRVVYEDQGPPLVMRPGDCVLQPPGIRHRVLECEAGSEVFELACPAVHLTSSDAEIELPTARLDPDRDFGGQRFVFHRAATATEIDGVRDLGLATATGGLVRGRVVRGSDSDVVLHDGELLLGFVLDGRGVLERSGTTDALSTGDTLAIPAGVAHRYVGDALVRLEISVAPIPQRDA